MTSPSRTARRRPFLQLDVFADAPQRGNPLAVVLDADGLSDADMQRIAQWTNLSETTFLLTPSAAGADYRVRIWTPSGELPFAGHPTLGTARAWLHAGGAPAGERIVQECGVGLVEVRCPGIGTDAGPQLAFAAPPLLREGPLEEDEVVAIAAELGVDRSAVRGHTWADNGPGWQVVELEDAQQVLALEPDLLGLGERKVGVLGWHDVASRADASGTAGADAAITGAESADAEAAGATSGAGSADAEPDAGRDAPLYEVRAFAPVGVEDPVTGSLNAGIGQWLMDRGEAPRRWTAAQGTVLGREGRISLEREEDGTLWVGGSTVLTIEGTILT